MRVPWSNRQKTVVLFSQSSTRGAHPPSEVALEILPAGRGPWGLVAELLPSVEPQVLLEGEVTRIIGKTWHAQYWGDVFRRTNRPEVTRQYICNG